MKSLTIHVKNLQYLVSEIYKVSKVKNDIFVDNIFTFQGNSNYNLGSGIHLASRNVRTHSVHPHPFCRWRGGIETPNKFSKMGLDRISVSRGGCWESGFHEKSVYRGEFPKKEGLGQFADSRREGGLTKKKGWCFWVEGCYTNAHQATKLFETETVFNLEAKIRLLLPGKPKGASSMQVF